MKLLKAAVALSSIALMSGGALAFDVDRGSAAERFAARNCAWCHGPSMQGFSTAPRLAGQKAAYIESQLQSLKVHGRDNPKSELYMWGAANVVSPEIGSELGAYLASLSPVAAADGDPDHADRGRAIYADGDAAANVPSCVVCHGPEAQGAGAIPRLAGLSHRYLKRRLRQWGEGYHASAVFPMPAVATNLSDDEIEALASYLSYIQ